MIALRTLSVGVCTLLWLMPYACGETGDEAADQLACSIPRQYWRNFDSLSKSMRRSYAGSRQFSSSENGRLRARLVYRWITGHMRYGDLNPDNFPLRPSYRSFHGSYFNDGYSPQSSLTRGYTNCGGFSLLFEALASQMDLKVEYFKGYARGFENVPRYHAWNAVKIGDEWKMIDATWGAVPQERENWFLVPSREFLKSHVPDSAYLDSSCYKETKLTQTMLGKLRKNLLR